MERTQNKQTISSLINGNSPISFTKINNNATGRHEEKNQVGWPAQERKWCTSSRATKQFRQVKRGFLMEDSDEERGVTSMEDTDDPFNSGPNCDMIKADISRFLGPKIDERSLWATSADFLRSSNSIEDINLATEQSTSKIEEPVIRGPKTDKTILTARQRSLRRRNVILNNLLGPLSPPTNEFEAESIESPRPDCDTVLKLPFERKPLHKKYSGAVDLHAVVKKLEEEYRDDGDIEPQKPAPVLNNCLLKPPPKLYFSPFLTAPKEELTFKMKADDFPALS